MVVTDYGLNKIRNWLGDSAITPPVTIGVGLGTTVPTGADVALNNEIYPTTTRNTSTRSIADGVVNYLMIMETTQGSTANYSEMGLFATHTGGSCWTRKIHPDNRNDGSIIMNSFIGLRVSTTNSEILQSLTVSFANDDDKDGATTADWNNGLNRLRMSDNPSHMLLYNTIGITSSISTLLISKVTVSATEVKYGSDSIQYFVSGDGGSNWTEFTNGVEGTVPSGNDLRVRVFFSGNGGTDTYITNLTIQVVT